MFVLNSDNACALEVEIYRLRVSLIDNSLNNVALSIKAVLLKLKVECAFINHESGSFILRNPNIPTGSHAFTEEL